MGLGRLRSEKPFGELGFSAPRLPDRAATIAVGQASNLNCSGTTGRTRTRRVPRKSSQEP
ncbi:MAG: hypothetical protein AVDCRST_MAG10-2579 [uncultured Acidimicrobiales bacterium]|uniref:Uncharacterized protein n=1 Tax=uncultured Acidimicrobiales bacterium TaxID=310071 RepID=A0A6J4IQZ9_9ACTN|nr:MAG: hypothetical protein AVDCRST_MAG10-2579 [uncultured Acidimicrobiales bacterium]